MDPPSGEEPKPCVDPGEDGGDASKEEEVDLPEPDTEQEARYKVLVELRRNKAPLVDILMKVTEFRKEKDDALLKHTAETVWCEICEKIGELSTAKESTSLDMLPLIQAVVKLYPGDDGVAPVELVMMAAKVEEQVLNDISTVVWDSIRDIVDETELKFARFLDVAEAPELKVAVQASPQKKLVYSTRADKPIPPATLITAMDHTGVTIPLERVGFEGPQPWLVCKGNVDLSAYTRSHGIDVMPSGDGPCSNIIRIVSNPNPPYDKRAVAHMANDGAVEVGLAGRPTFLDRLTYPLDPKDPFTKASVIEAIKTYYKKAATECNACWVRHKGVLFLASLPVDDPVPDEEIRAKFPPMPRIRPGDVIKVAYSPAKWFESLAPESQSYTARMSFMEMVTARDLDLIESEGIPIRRHSIFDL